MKNEKELNEIVKNIPLGAMPGFFTIMNTSLEYLVVNTPTISLIGYKNMDQLTGTTYFNMPCKASESADIFIKEDKKVLGCTQPLKVLSYQCFNDNNWKILIGEKAPLLAQNGEIIGITAHFIDVTDLRLVDMGRFLINKNLKYHPKNRRKQFSFTLENSFQDYGLSARQAECLFFLIRGKTIKNIAAVLNLSERTVEGYINEIKFKLKCFHKADIIEKTISEGFLNVIPSSLTNKLSSQL